MRITLDNLDAVECLPPDMGKEAYNALTAGREKSVLYCAEFDQNKEKTHYLWLPNAGRGGVCCGGNTEWTDCDSLEDLANRWDNYEEGWSN